MSLLIDTKVRIYDPEIMDDFDLGGPVLHDALDKLSLINKWLGGNAVTIGGLKKLLKHHPRHKTLSIVDLGCGSGDTLRAIDRFGKKHGYSFKLTGVDANSHVINYARSLSRDKEDIRFFAYDIFSKEFDDLEFDIAVCTLFLHHFEDEQLLEVLGNMLRKASTGIIANDLHRNALAYLLFQGLSLFFTNEMVGKDGLTSIKRGFKRNELEEYSKRIDSKYSISWKWAFRYQWLMQKK